MSLSTTLGLSFGGRLSLPPFCANVQPEISAPANTANRIFLNLPITILPPPCVLYSTLEGEAERRAALDFSNMNAKTLHQPPWLPDLEISGLGLLVSRCLRPASVTHRMLTWAANFAPYRARLADIGPIWVRYRLIVTLALPTLLLLSKALNEIVCSPAPGIKRSSE